MLRKENVESGGDPVPGAQPDPENKRATADDRGDQGLVPMTEEAWIHTLVAGWSARYLKPQLGAEEPEIDTLLRLSLLSRFETAFNERIAALTHDDVLPEKRAGEEYPLEYAEILAKVYEEARIEAGWDPMQQSTEIGRELK